VVALWVNIPMVVELAVHILTKGLEMYLKTHGYKPRADLTLSMMKEIKRFRGLFLKISMHEVCFVDRCVRMFSWSSTTTK